MIFNTTFDVSCLRKSCYYSPNTAYNGAYYHLDGSGGGEWLGRRW